MMRGYYVGNLAGERLRRCYELASERVRRYLASEIEFVLSRLEHDHAVLELGCGYGRVTFRLAECARRVIGIDTATDSLELARQIGGSNSECRFLKMDALELAFRDSTFDRVVCVQNGICAFGVDQETLLNEAQRVTRPGGRLLFSSYSKHFWSERLGWFESQAAAGLIGELDYRHTGGGIIACKDGFHTGMLSSEQFQELGKRLGVEPAVSEVDSSSIFCEIVVPDRA
jgi:ubiquinone/menaquinone biosynthesis C-methylase UbiE